MVLHDNVVDGKPLAGSTCMCGPAIGHSSSLLCLAMPTDQTYSFITTLNILPAPPSKCLEGAQYNLISIQIHYIILYCIFIVLCSVLQLSLYFVFCRPIVFSIILFSVLYIAFLLVY